LISQNNNFAKKETNMKRLMIALVFLPAGLQAMGTLSAVDKAIIDGAKKAQTQSKPQPQPPKPPKK
jgi:hypothetical protein